MYNHGCHIQDFHIKLLVKDWCLLRRYNGKILTEFGLGFWILSVPSGEVTQADALYLSYSLSGLYR